MPDSRRPQIHSDEGHSGHVAEGLAYLCDGRQGFVGD